MKQSQRIVKNILAGGVGVGLGGLLQMVALVMVARHVSVAQFGTYSFILAFGLFFQMLADSGLSNILMRDLAVHPEKISEVLGGALSLVWLMSFLVGALMVAVIPLLRFSLEIKVLTGVMGAATLTQFHNACYGAVLRSQEDNELHSLGFLLHKVFFLAIIYAGLKLNLALAGVVASHLISSIALSIFYRSVVVWKYSRPRVRLDFALWKYLLTNSIPVGGATIVRLLALQIDVIILTWMADMKTVGLFSGPFRLTMALRFIPMTVAIPLYPLFSRLARSPDSNYEFGEAYQRSFKLFVISGFAVAAAFVAASDMGVALLLGPRYQSSVTTMQLLGLGFLPFFVASPFPFLLTAAERQRFLFKTAAIVLVLRIVLDVLLIPYSPLLGPCFAFFLSETLLVAVWVEGLRRMGYRLEVINHLWRPAVAAVCMSATLYLCKDHSLLMLVPAGLLSSLVFVAMLFWLGAFSSSDLALAKEGLSFLRPFLEKWRSQLQRSAT